MGNGKKDRDGESAQLVGSSSRDLEWGEEEGSSEKCKERSKNCGSKCLACFRCVFGFVLFPFVFLLTLLAVIVWIILLPGNGLSFCAPLFILVRIERTGFIIISDLNNNLISQN